VALRKRRLKLAVRPRVARRVGSVSDAVTRTFAPPGRCGSGQRTSRGARTSSITRVCVTPTGALALIEEELSAPTAAARPVQLLVAPSSRASYARCRLLPLCGARMSSRPRRWQPDPLPGAPPDDRLALPPEGTFRPPRAGLVLTDGERNRRVAVSTVRRVRLSDGRQFGGRRSARGVVQAMPEVRRSARARGGGPCRSGLAHG
jgi:hypothetical protein